MNFWGWEGTAEHTLNHFSPSISKFYLPSIFNLPSFESLKAHQHDYI